MARQRSPLNKQTPLGTKLYTNNAHSGAKKARSALKSVREKKPFYQIARRNALARKRGPRSTYGVDDNLVDPIAVGDSDDDISEKEDDSSEGEDWEDGNTLVSKFMEADLDGPQNTEDDLLNLVEGLKVPFSQSNAALRQDLRDVIAPTMDLIGEAHRQISDQKGPDGRMREGAQRFLGYTPEFTQTVVNSQVGLEQARAKCEETTAELVEKLKHAYKKKRQDEVQFNAALNVKVKSMMEIHDQFDKEINQLQLATDKKLKDLAKLDSRKKFQNILSIIS